MPKTGPVTELSFGPRTAQRLIAVAANPPRREELPPEPDRRVRVLESIAAFMRARRNEDE